MSETTIEWCNRPGMVPRTWNPTRGCSHAKLPDSQKSDPACAHCYAERNGARQANGGVYTGLIKIGTGGAPRWTGRVDESKNLADPLRWSKPSSVFVNSMSDLFHEDLPRAATAAVIGVTGLARAQRHTFMVLTKRAERMATMMSGLTWFECDNELAGRSWDQSRPDREKITKERGEFENTWPLPNLWLGVSIGTRSTLFRLDALRATPAAIRFVSFEPLIEDLGRVDLRGINWIVIGGESGPKSRGCDVRWIRSLMVQARAARCAVFVKQLGARAIDSNDAGFMGDPGDAWPTIYGGIQAIDEHQGGDCVVGVRDRKGGDPDEWPMDLRVREFPEVRI